MYLLKLYSLGEAVQRVSQLLWGVLLRVLCPSSVQLQESRKHTIGRSAVNTTVRQNPKGLHAKLNQSLRKDPPVIDGIEYVHRP